MVAWYFPLTLIEYSNARGTYRAAQQLTSRWCRGILCTCCEFHYDLCIANKCHMSWPRSASPQKSGGYDVESKCMIVWWLHNKIENRELRLSVCLCVKFTNSPILVRPGLDSDLCTRVGYCRSRIVRDATARDKNRNCIWIVQRQEWNEGYATHHFPGL